MSERKRIRLDLDERRARAVHAAIREALNAQLLAGDHRDAARDVLEQLDNRVPGWIEAGPIGGEAGYLAAAQAVLRALVDAEERGRSMLSESELLRVVGDAKPLGTTANDVLDRMRREKFLTIDRRHDEPWVKAAAAGRRFLHRDTAIADTSWAVSDYNALLDLIYAENRAGGEAHRPSIQAIGRLEDAELTELADALIGFDFLAAPDLPVVGITWLELTAKGLARARDRWKESAPPGVYRSTFDGPPAPPLPYQRRLPLRIAPDDRHHPPRYESDDVYNPWCPPANWLQRSSKTKLFAALKRDGAVPWTCSNCGGRWLVYLQAFTAADEPAYADPAAAAYNRPLWRGRVAH